MTCENNLFYFIKHENDRVDTIWNLIEWPHKCNKSIGNYVLKKMSVTGITKKSSYCPLLLYIMYCYIMFVVVIFITLATCGLNHANVLPVMNDVHPVIGGLRQAGQWQVGHFKLIFALNNKHMVDFQLARRFSWQANIVLFNKYI